MPYGKALINPYLTVSVLPYSVLYLEILYNKISIIRDYSTEQYGRYITPSFPFSRPRIGYSNLLPNNPEHNDGEDGENDDQDTDRNRTSDDVTGVDSRLKSLNFQIQNFLVLKL